MLPTLAAANTTASGFSAAKTHSRQPSYPNQARHGYAPKYALTQGIQAVRNNAALHATVACYIYFRIEVQHEWRPLLAAYRNAAPAFLQQGVLVCSTRAMANPGNSSKLFQNPVSQIQTLQVFNGGKPCGWLGHNG